MTSTHRARRISPDWSDRTVTPARDVQKGGQDVGQSLTAMTPTLPKSPADTRAPETKLIGRGFREVCLEGAATSRLRLAGRTAPPLFGTHKAKEWGCFR